MCNNFGCNCNKFDVYRLREIGKEGCATLGSKHYIQSSSNVEPLDLIIAQNMLKDFCLANIIKYAGRFKQTNNLKDLVKIVDYAHILYGYEKQTKGEIKNGNE